jgi:hypothetical protein
MRPREVRDSLRLKPDAELQVFRYGDVRRGWSSSAITGTWAAAVRRHPAKLLHPLAT